MCYNTYVLVFFFVFFFLSFFLFVARKGCNHCLWLAFPRYLLLQPLVYYFSVTVAMLHVNFTFTFISFHHHTDLLFIFVWIIEPIFYLKCWFFRVLWFLGQLVYNSLTLSVSPRDSLKYFEVSVPRHIRFAELRKIGAISPIFHNIL